MQRLNCVCYRNNRTCHRIMPNMWDWVRWLDSLHTREEPIRST